MTVEKTSETVTRIHFTPAKRSAITIAVRIGAGMLPIPDLGLSTPAVRSRHNHNHGLIRSPVLTSQEAPGSAWSLLCFFMVRCPEERVRCFRLVFREPWKIQKTSLNRFHSDGFGAW